MNIGDLRHRVAIQARDATLDVYGQPAQTWTTTATVWGSVADISGKELLAAMAVQSEVSTHITIRYRAGVTTANRILYDGVIYNISAVVDPTGRKRETNLMCARNANQG